MKTSQLFALNEWLSDFPDNMTYEEILAVLRDPENTWCADNITVWEVVEDCLCEQVADFIESTQKHFARVTEEQTT